LIDNIQRIVGDVFETKIIWSICAIRELLKKPIAYLTHKSKTVCDQYEDETNVEVKYQDYKAQHKPRQEYYRIAPDKNCQKSQ
jgi:hypothetical protein